MVRTLNEAWSTTLEGVLGKRVGDCVDPGDSALSEKPAWVNLAAETYIDAEGLTMLTLMARLGAAIVAANSLNQDLAEGIKTSSRSES